MSAGRRIMDDHYSILRADRLGESSLKFCAGATDIQHQVGVGLHLVLKLRWLLRRRFTLPAAPSPKQIGNKRLIMPLDNGSPVSGIDRQWFALF